MTAKTITEEQWHDLIKYYELIRKVCIDNGQTEILRLNLYPIATRIDSGVRSKKNFDSMIESLLFVKEQLPDLFPQDPGKSDIPADEKTGSGSEQPKKKDE